MKKLLLFAALVSVATLSAFWAGQKTCSMMLASRAQTSNVLYGGLDLSADQSKSLQAIEKSFLPRADELCLQICLAKQNLLNDMQDPRVDREALFRKIDDIGKLQTSLEKEVASHILQVRSILTPSQSKAYHARIEREFQKALEQSGYAMMKL